jgi:hypothetical protein
MGAIVDSHGLGFILQDADGYLHFFYGCHDTEMKYKRSTDPSDSTSWETMASPIWPASYPSAYLLNNHSIFLIYRYAYDGNHWQYQLSNDSGDSWSDPHELIVDQIDPDLMATYPLFDFEQTPTNETLHISWTVANYTSGIRENLYYASLDLGTVTLRTANGTSLGDCITPEEMDQALVYDSGSYNVWLPAVDYENDTIAIAWTRQDSVSTSVYTVAVWDGDGWDLLNVSSHASIYGTTSVFVNSPSDLAVYYVDGFGNGGSVYRKNWDGSVWSSPSLILDFTLAESDRALYYNQASFGYFGSRETLVFGEVSTGQFKWRMYVYSRSYGFLTNGTALEYPQSTGPNWAGAFATIGIILVVVYWLDREIGLEDVIDDLLKRSKR